MRDLLSKIVTGSLIAGSALLVVACGSNEDANVSNTTLNVEETMPVNDMTNVDAMDGTGANIGAMDSTGNATTTDTTVNTTDTTTTTNTTTTNGM
jgi:hypothetical protein